MKSADTHSTAFAGYVPGCATRLDPEAPADAFEELQKVAKSLLCSLERSPALIGALPVGQRQLTRLLGSQRPPSSLLTSFRYKAVASPVGTTSSADEGSQSSKAAQPDPSAAGPSGSIAPAHQAGAPAHTDAGLFTLVSALSTL